MTNKSHLTRCATLAIAATLALGPTQLLAQDVAAPTVTAAPPPTIIVPDIAPEPAVPAPSASAPTVVVPDVPEPEAAAPVEAEPATPRAATTTRSTPARSTPARTAPAATAAEPATADAAPADTAVTEAPTFVPPVAAEPLPQADIAPTTTETRTADNSLAIAIGILAALALIVIGFFAMRRKGTKRYAVAEQAAEPRIERPVPARAQPLPASTAAPEFPAGLQPETVVAENRPNVSYTGTTFGAAAAKPASALSHTGAAVALPREVPKSHEEREALIKRMVDAKPDRANPFRSKRARMKRARLILASLHRDFKNADPWIDLGQYSSNWPELARRHPVAA